MDLQRHPPFVLLARLGLVGGVDLIGGPLQQQPHQYIGRLEESGAHQYLQVLNDQPVGLLGLKSGNQLLDLLALGLGDAGCDGFTRLGGLFLFMPMFNSARVWSMTAWAYWWVSFWYCW